MEDIESNPEIQRIEKEWQLFVAMFNSINQTTFNTETGLDNQQLIDLFIDSRGFLSSRQEEVKLKAPVSTKVRSFNDLKTTSIDYKVFKELENRCYTRKELQHQLGIRTQTITGAITRLKHMGMIHAIGEAYDQETKRMVEIYQTKKEL